MSTVPKTLDTPDSPEKQPEIGLLKTGGLTFISSGIKIMAAFIINKVIALYIGPSGLASIGQFQNFLSISLTLSTGAVDSGVVKYIAESKGNPTQQNAILGTALKIALVCSSILGILIFALSHWLSLFLLRTDAYHLIFKVFSITLTLYALNTLLLSALNGLREIKKYILINIYTSLTILVLTSCLTIQFSLYGALLSLSITQSIIFFITLFFVVKTRCFQFHQFKAPLDPHILKQLLHFSIMAITSTIAVPGTQLIIRNFIINHLSLQDAGYWQGVSKISDVYLMVITSSLATYYLPKLSEIQDKAQLRKEIFQSYKIVLPVVICSASIIYLLREWIITLLFSTHFFMMKDLFLFQLLGDCFKIASWILSYLLIAKAMTKWFVISEISFSLLYLGLAFYFISQHGLVGATEAFALNYLIYLILLFWFFRDLIFNPHEQVIS